jgi:hypothetical protein
VKSQSTACVPLNWIEFREIWLYCSWIEVSVRGHAWISAGSSTFGGGVAPHRRKCSGSPGASAWTFPVTCPGPSAQPTGIEIRGPPGHYTDW